MPNGDGTGPVGEGPMTGRAAGLCAGSQVPGYMNPAGGRGFMGRGRGFGGRGGGRGFRNRFFATGQPGWARAGLSYQGPIDPAVNDEQVLAILKNQADSLQHTLDQINKRMEQLETKSD